MIASPPQNRQAAKSRLHRVRHDGGSAEQFAGGEFIALGIKTAVDLDPYVAPGLVERRAVVQIQGFGRVDEPRKHRSGTNPARERRIPTCESSERGNNDHALGMTAV